MRVKHGCSSLEGLLDVAWKAHNGNAEGLPVRQDHLLQPRWVRVNSLRTSVDEQLRTNFANYKQVGSLNELQKLASQEVLVIDQHIPNLIALPSSTDLTKSPAYIDGNTILQDKASCFPAYLLNPTSGDRNLVDACAAPGNKTTHLAAICHDNIDVKERPWIIACERDKSRSQTLTNMVQKAGAQHLVKVHAGMDFLKITELSNAPWNNVTALLLDPSCSGSGMVGRDDVLKTVLPQKKPPSSSQETGRRKRKRQPSASDEKASVMQPNDIPSQEDSVLALKQRLDTLADFQLRLVLHAFTFPAARRITYSTCSVYEEEDEEVVRKALSSDIAKNRGWRILKRSEQVDGLQRWPIRGKREAFERHKLDGELDAAEMADGCIRCEKGTKEGTQGFFVAGFIRNEMNADATDDAEQEDEWDGLSD